MNNENTSKDSDNKQNNGEYRRVLATANKLETIQSNLESVIDFFLAPMVKLYTKLCNDSLKLLFESHFKLDHFRKAEELVWRRIYHDVYRFHKTQRQSIRRQDECLMESHFISGIGFYSTLIVKLRSHYKIDDAHAVIGPLNLTLGPLDNFLDNDTVKADDRYKQATDDDSLIQFQAIDDEAKTDEVRAQEWAKQAIYRSLVYMGDLARYLLETSQFDYRKLAFEFYKSASRCQPDYGLPFNQLATLAGGLNHNLDAICNYMRCCLKPKPFERAEGNMKKVFDLNRKFFTELGEVGYVDKMSDVLSSKDPSFAAESMIRAIIVIFIKLTADLWESITTTLDDDTRDCIIQEIKLFFEMLKESLELEPIVPMAGSVTFEQEFYPISGGSSFNMQPKYLSPTIMYEFCSISIMLIAKNQKQQSAEGYTFDHKSGYIKDLVNTLALNLLHYATSKCQKMILSKLQELRVNRQEMISSFGQTGKSCKQTSDPNLRGSGGNLSTSSQRSVDGNLVSTSDINNKRTLSRLRQRRAATNYSDKSNRLRAMVHQNRQHHTEDSDMSELEETALSTIDALEISSDMSENDDYQVNDLINLDSSSDDVSNTSRRFKSDRLSRPALRPTRSQNYEHERTRSINMFNSTSSLPVPDLLTGDTDERVNRALVVPSEGPMGSLSGLFVTDDKFSSDHYGKSSSIANDSSDLYPTLTYVYTQTYLPTIKIFCDWLLTDGEIVNSNVQSFQNFSIELQEMVSLLNDLKKFAGNSNDDVAPEETSGYSAYNDTSSDAQVLKHVFDGPEWVQRYPLSCDFPMLSLAPLKSVHDVNIEFEHQRELTDFESGFITIQCIVAFSHALEACLLNKPFQ